MSEQTFRTSACTQQGARKIKPTFPPLLDKVSEDYFWKG